MCLIITHAWAWSKVWIVGATFKLKFLGWALTMRWLIVLPLFWFSTEGVYHWTEGQNKINKLNDHQKQPSKSEIYGEWAYTRAQSQLRRLSIFSINTSVILLPNHVSNGWLFYFACTTVLKPTVEEKTRQKNGMDGHIAKYLVQVQLRIGAIKKRCTEFVSKDSSF